jgi:hypothetical protein
MNANEKLIAAERFISALKKNPEDIQALLQGAILVGQLKKPDLEAQRLFLTRILSLEPTHQKAREMLLALDRAELQSGISRVAAEPVIPTSPPAVQTQPEEPLVSRYSAVNQLLVYLLVGNSLLFLLKAMGDWVVFGCFAVGCLILLLPIWIVSAVVTVTDSGISLSRLFGLYRREAAWGEIESLEPGPLGAGLDLKLAGGRWLVISSQMSRYAAIVAILQRSRPDLFSLPGAGSFSGSKTFRKGFFGKYALFFLASILTVATLTSIPTILFAILFGIFSYAAWNAALRNVHTVTLEGDRLSARSMRDKHDLTAQQVRDIRILTRYNRRGVATNFIQIDRQEGDEIVLWRFPEGNEIMYGFLRNWWLAARDA